MKLRAQSPAPAPGALEAMAAWATGTAAPAQHSPATRAAQLREAVSFLLEHETPAARHVAHALERWLVEGGDLVKLLGLRPRRGGRTETPQRVARMAGRDALLRDVAAGLPGTLTARAAAIAAMVRANDPAVLVIREQTKTPISARQIVRILRAPASE